MKVLLVDDDRELVDLLTFTLRRHGFRVVAAFDPETALVLLRSEQPDIAMLDVNLGLRSGFDLLRTLRQRSDIPVIMLTGRSSEEDKVEGLDLGADDYLVKPFGHRELLARLRAQLRRAGKTWSAPEPERAVLEAGPLRLNLRDRTVTRDGTPVELTVTEFRVLQYLMGNAGAVVPTTALLKHVWGQHAPGATDVVRVTLHRLRRKVEEDSDHPQLLHTVPGVGVILRAETPAAASPPEAPPPEAPGEPADLA